MGLNELGSTEKNRASMNLAHGNGTGHGKKKKNSMNSDNSGLHEQNEFQDIYEWLVKSLGFLEKC